MTAPKMLRGRGSLTRMSKSKGINSFPAFYDNCYYSTIKALKK